MKQKQVAVSTNEEKRPAKRIEVAEQLKESYRMVCLTNAGLRGATGDIYYYDEAEGIWMPAESMLSEKIRYVFPEDNHESDVD